MPGQLKPDAKCPLCDEPLDFLVDETSSAGVVRKLYHGKVGKRRRKNPCTQNFPRLDIATAYRKMLEV